MPIVKDLLILMLIANALAILLFAWIGYRRWHEPDHRDPGKTWHVGGPRR